MTETKLPLVATLLVTTLLASPVFAQKIAEGAEPPLNCWTTEDGSPSGSRRTSTRPLRGLAEVGWSREFDGELEGEPLVWEETVVVVEKIADDKRRIHVLNLADGTGRASSPVIKSSLPLEPSIWGKLIVARVESAKIQSWKIGYTRLYKKWSVEAPGPISRPVLIGNEVYVRALNSLIRYDYGEKEAVWSSRAGAFHGTPSVYGPNVYSVVYGGATGTVGGLMVLDRKTGSETVSVGMADLAGPVPGVESGRVRIGPQDIVVHFGARLQNGLQDIRIRCATGPPRFGDLMPGPSSPCALYADRFIGPLRDLGTRDLKLVDGGHEQYRILASNEIHIDFVRRTIAPIVSQDVAYLAPAAVNLSGDAFKVLWRVGNEFGRFVPAREAVLAIRGEHELVALRTRNDESAGWRRKIPANAEARVVLVDGQTREALVKVDGETVSVHKRKETWDEYPLASVILIETLAGEILYWPSTSRAMRGFDVVRDGQRAEGYLELCRKSARSKDPDLMARYLEVARRNGVEEEDLASTRKAETSERKKKKPSKIRSKVVEEVEALDAAVQRRPIELLENRLATLPTDAPRRVRFAVLRRLVEADPKNASAVATIREFLPPKLRPTGKFSAADWFDFAEAIRQTPIEVILPPTLEQKETTWEERELGATQATWRKDLVALKSERLLILTPLQNPSSVARCLSLGELVCDALEEIFAEGDVARDARFPLKLHLYENRDEYVKESRRRGLGDLGHTAGHYSPSENVSRMFVPKRSELANDMLDTYIHELTHHWMEQRCPLFSTSKSMSQNPLVEGYWVVEGLAVMLEEFIWDAVQRRWSVNDPRADSLDTVANAKENQILPWETLYKIHQVGLNRFVGKTPVEGLEVQMTWTLGAQRQLSWMNVFYAQSAATCHYLFSRDELRPKLLEFIRKYYTGETKGLTMKKAFGITATELGRRVAAYAAERSRVD